MSRKEALGFRRIWSFELPSLGHKLRAAQVAWHLQHGILRNGYRASFIVCLSEDLSKARPTQSISE